MDREAFEQLVSEWLDQPQRDDLRVLLEQALADNPAWVGLRREYTQLDRLIKQATSKMPAVDWPLLKRRIMAELTRAVVSHSDDAAFDERLRAALPAFEGRVDWRAFGRHLSERIELETHIPRVIRLNRWRGTIAAGVLAAAAALLLMLTPPTAQLPGRKAEPSPGYVRVEVLPPAGVDVDIDPGGAVAFAIVTVDIKSEVMHVLNYSYSGDQPSSSLNPEDYFMLEPLDLSGMMASAGGYGAP